MTPITVPATARERVLALVMASGIYVSVEPAPFDIAIVLLGVLQLATRQLRMPRGALVAAGLLALFAFSNLISMVFMTGPRRGYAFFAVTAYLMGVWAVTLTVQGRGGARSTDAMLAGYAAGGGVAAAAGVAAYLGAPRLGPIMVPDGRLYGFFKDPNVFGAFLVPASVFAFSRVVLPLGRHRFAWTCVLGACTGAVFLSFSRGAWINLALALTTFFVLFTFADGLGRVWWRTVVFLPLLLAVLSACAYQLVSVDTISEMFQIRFAYQPYDDRRFAIQLRAVQVALAHPWGLGPGATEQAFTTAAHSLYVRTLVENGVLGALSLLTFGLLSVVRALAASVFSTSRDDRIRFAVVSASLLGAAVESFVIDTVHWRHLWVLYAFAWAPMPRLRLTRTLPPPALRPSTGCA